MSAELAASEEALVITGPFMCHCSGLAKTLLQGFCVAPASRRGRFLTKHQLVASFRERLKSRGVAAGKNTFQGPCSLQPHASCQVFLEISVSLPAPYKPYSNQLRRGSAAFGTLSMPQTGREHRMRRSMAHEQWCRGDVLGITSARHPEQAPPLLPYCIRLHFAKGPRRDPAAHLPDVVDEELRWNGKGSRPDQAAGDLAVGGAHKHLLTPT